MGIYSKHRKICKCICPYGIVYNLDFSFYSLFRALECLESLVFRVLRSLVTVEERDFASLSLMDPLRFTHCRLFQKVYKQIEIVYEHK